MPRLRTHAPLACLLGAALLAGCATKPPLSAASVAPQMQAAAPAPVIAPGISGLNQGITMYNNGDYNDAIKRLNAADVTGGSKATQLEALKYTAFSYCVTARTTLCRQQFEKALKLDASFDLNPGERGHPLWGPAFIKAKKSK